MVHNPSGLDTTMYVGPGELREEDICAWRQSCTLRRRPSDFMNEIVRRIIVRQGVSIRRLFRQFLCFCIDVIGKRQNGRQSLDECPSSFVRSHEAIALEL
jgi:hypothetical protein